MHAHHDEGVTESKGRETANRSGVGSESGVGAETRSGAGAGTGTLKSCRRNGREISTGSPGLK